MLYRAFTDRTAHAFAGEMTMVVTFGASAGGTVVTIVFEDNPPGIRPEDNDAGTRSSLEQLARYVDGGQEKRVAS